MFLNSVCLFLFCFLLAPLSTSGYACGDRRLFRCSCSIAKRMITCTLLAGKTLKDAPVARVIGTLSENSRITRVWLTIPDTELTHGSLIKELEELNIHLSFLFVNERLFGNTFLKFPPKPTPLDNLTLNENLTLLANLTLNENSFGNYSQNSLNFSISNENITNFNDSSYSSYPNSQQKVNETEGVGSALETTTEVPSNSTSVLPNSTPNVQHLQDFLTLYMPQDAPSKPEPSFGEDYEPFDGDADFKPEPSLEEPDAPCPDGLSESLGAVTMMLLVIVMMMGQKIRTGHWTCRRFRNLPSGLTSLRTRRTRRFNPDVGAGLGVVLPLSSTPRVDASGTRALDRRAQADSASFEMEMEEHLYANPNSLDSSWESSI